MFFKNFKKKYEIDNKDFNSMFKVVSDCLPIHRIIQNNDKIHLVTIEY